MMQGTSIFLIVLLGLCQPASAAGACSADDQTFIKAHPGTGDDSFGKMVGDCGKQAYSIVGGFNQAKFKTCLDGKAKISDACSGCYAQAGSYGASNCKSACIFSWCSKGCLDCTSKNKPTLDACTGFPEEDVKPCSSSEEKATEVFSNTTSDVNAFIQGGSLKVTWSDCGDADTLGKVTDVTPTTLPLGQKTLITGTGTLSKDVAGGTFVIDAHSSFIHKTYNGDFCKPLTVELPLGVGSFTWKGMPCPVPAGSMSEQLEFELSSKIPASLAKSTIQVKATATNGDKIGCMAVTTGPATADIII